MMSWKLAIRAIFDLIQGITNENMKNLQVTDLEWPEGSTFCSHTICYRGAMPTQALCRD